MKMETMIGAVHLFIMVISGFFFLFPKSKVDLWFLFMVYGTFVSWTLFKGRCLISYSVGRPNDPATKTIDVYRLFPRSKEANVAAGNSLLNKLKLISVFIVLWRNNFNILMILPLLVYNAMNKTRLGINLVFFCIFAIQIVIIVHAYRSTICSF